MKKSRLNLFRVTSMTLSILGVIMIIATILVLLYIGFEGISSKLSSNVNMGTSYDQLAVLKSDYSSLKIQYDSVKSEIYSTNNTPLKKRYISAELELIKTGSAISDVESALSSDKPADEVKKRIKIAQNQLQIAKTSLSEIRGSF
jgi:hypothetical protein